MIYEISTTLIGKILQWFEAIITTIADITNWLFTPTDIFAVVGWESVAPIEIFTLAGLLVILVLHLAHLVNVIAG